MIGNKLLVLMSFCFINVSMNSQTEFKKSVLNYMDSCAKGYEFLLMDDPYVFPIATRVFLCKGGTNWTIVFEKIGYHSRNNFLFSELTYLGFYEKTEDFTTNHKVWDVLLSSEDLVALQELDDEEHFEYVSPNADSISINDSVLSVDSFIVDDSNHFVDFFRRIADSSPELLFQKDSISLRFLNFSPSNTICIYDWIHHDDLPSTSGSYVEMIDFFLEDSFEWKEINGNIHWSHWPDAGNL